mgnify:CR=1 FL=1
MKKNKINSNYIMKYLTIFLLINAIFWGLMSHSIHCKFVASFGIQNCPPHYVHLLMGLVSYLIAIYLEQKEYLKTIM